jgi:hypothetical protein
MIRPVRASQPSSGGPLFLHLFQVCLHSRHERPIGDMVIVCLTRVPYAAFGWGAGPHGPASLSYTRTAAGLRRRMLFGNRPIRTDGTGDKAIAPCGRPLESDVSFLNRETGNRRYIAFQEQHLTLRHVSCLSSSQQGRRGRGCPRRSDVSSVNETAKIGTLRHGSANGTGAARKKSGGPHTDRTRVRCGNSVGTDINHTSQTEPDHTGELMKIISALGYFVLFYPICTVVTWMVGGLLSNPAIRNVNKVR